MRFLATLVALVTVISLRLAAGIPPAIDLVDIPQGVSAFNVRDVGHVFVRREGLLLYAWDDRTRAGKEVVWCPREQLFWSPASLAVYDRYGNPERFGDPDRDVMVALHPSIDAAFRMHVAREKPTLEVPKQKVPLDVLDFYDRWRNQDIIPTTSNKLVWCPKPLR